MKHSVSELFDVVYQYFPRGQWIEKPGYPRWPTLLHPPKSASSERYRDWPYQAWPPPGYDDTEEQHRLNAASIKAGADPETWRVILRRIDARLPGYVAENGSLHLPVGGYGACYTGWIDLPLREPREILYGLRFLVSFVVPYYVVHSCASVNYTDERGKPILDNMLDFSPDEKPCVPVIVEELRAAFAGYEPMPPEIGNLVVPEAVTHFKMMGEATIYGCLFTPYW